jgi:hypothetical protein
MKFEAAENSVLGCRLIEPLERESVQREIRGSKWLVWHGKGTKAVACIEALDAELLRRPDYEFSTLWWNLRKVSGYLRSHAGYLANYGRRHHKGLPISSGIAESAVSQVVNMRMAKKQQMRRSDEGAHLLAQVRVHEINGDLRPRAVSIPLRPLKPASDALAGWPIPLNIAAAVAPARASYKCLAEAPAYFRTKPADRRSWYPAARLSRCASARGSLATKSPVAFHAEPPSERTLPSSRWLMLQATLRLPVVCTALVALATLVSVISTI